MKNLFKKLLFLLWITVLITGCSKTTDQQSTPSIQPELILTATLTQISTNTAAPLPTIALTPTEMTIPTLIPDEKVQLTKILLENNGGCTLPCWWGITPGITRWNDMRRILSPFAQVPEYYRNSQSDGHQYIEVNIPVPKNIASIGVISQYITAQNGIVKTVEISHFIWPRYTLSAFLQKNGKPEEVWIYSLKTNLGGPPPFWLMLYYPHKGIFARFYENDDLSSYKHKYIYACIDNGPELLLWSSGESLNFKKFIDEYKLGFSQDDLIIPIEKALGMTIDNFYKTYKNSDQVPCFLSLRDIWLEP